MYYIWFQKNLKTIFVVFLGGLKKFLTKRLVLAYISHRGKKMYCCCNCICPRNDPCRGPTGPTGPAGPSGTQRVADFYNLSTGELADETAIDLLENINLDSTDISHSFGSSDVVLMTPGYYSIVYNADGSRSGDGVVGLKVRANGNDVAISQSFANVVVGNLANLSSSFIFNNTDVGTVLNLVNASGASAAFINVNVVVQKVSN